MENGSDSLNHLKMVSLNVFVRLRIDDRSCKALEWMNKEKGIFKVYWSTKNCPNFHVTKKLCEDWADNRGVKHGLLDFTQLKKRFLSALTKSAEFSELTQLNGYHQSGNFKVFQFNTPEQAEEKRKRVKQKKNEDTKETTSAPEIPSQEDDCIVDEACEILQEILQQSDHSSFELNSVEEELMIQDLKDSLDNSYEMNATDSPPSQSHEIVCDENRSPAQMHQDVPTCSGADMDFLQCFALPPEKLPVFDATLLYEKDVYATERLDYSGGFRFHGSDVTRQEAIRALNADGSREELKFFSCSFPDYRGVNSHVSKILSKTDLGVVLTFKSDLKLYGMRLCSSRVFFNSFDQTGETFIKMERDKPVVLFSYLDYIQKSIQFIQSLPHGNVVTLPECQVKLSFGIHPSTPQSTTLISLVLEPVLTQHIFDKFGINNGSFFSNDNSLDILIEKMAECKTV